MHTKIISKYSDEEVNRILAAAVSNGIMSGTSLREYALKIRSRRQLGVKATANKKVIKNKHRAMMSARVDSVANKLEAHLDAYTTNVLEKHFSSTSMPTPTVDVPWVASFARPAIANSFFTDKDSDTDDVKQAKAIIRPIFRAMNNLALQSKKKGMIPMKRVA